MCPISELFSIENCHSLGGIQKLVSWVSILRFSRDGAPYRSNSVRHLRYTAFQTSSPRLRLNIHANLDTFQSTWTSSRRPRIFDHTWTDFMNSASRRTSSVNNSMSIIRLWWNMLYRYTPLIFLPSGHLHASNHRF